ncbi:MAG: putative metal-binding motif-containing protein [Sandaracinaceae bacterium]|nr:putative metal-binding motif-containing protein [Sandaracinaceae bacterium]
MDAGRTPDGGTDAGPECTSSADCDDLVNCTRDTCMDGTCVNEPDDTICVPGETCDPVMGCPPVVCATPEECNDFRVCNGEETCTDMACAPVSGTAIDCNDSDPCTADRCSEAMRGDCVHTTADRDEDGFGDATCAEVGGVPATDCNDDNPDVNPEAVEVCDGFDNDCNGTCDDAFTCCRGEVGTCTSSCGTTGTRVCGSSCSWGVCSPPAEECNAVDDDCNGAADDVFACVQGATESCTTSCGSTGMRTCQSDCSWSDCVAPSETCNGRDDDCDGTPDEGFACVAGSGVSCTTSCGSTGTQTCDATCTMGSCVPPAEGCTGMDDDCDGMIDETVECSAGAMESCTTSCGSTGMRTCTAACTFGSCTPPAEVCNGADDDCDGSIDETFTCVPGAMGSCTSSCGTTGTRTCTSSCTWGSCTPPVEACNGLDDNCNSMCDETFACCAGSSGTCTTSCGTMGDAQLLVVVRVERVLAARRDVQRRGRRLQRGVRRRLHLLRGPDEHLHDHVRLDRLADLFVHLHERHLQPARRDVQRRGRRLRRHDRRRLRLHARRDAGLHDELRIDRHAELSGRLHVWQLQPADGELQRDGRRLRRHDRRGLRVVLGLHRRGGRLGAGRPLRRAAGSGHALRLLRRLGGSEGYLTFTLPTASDVFITTHHAGSTDTVLYVRDCTCGGPEISGACNDNADGRTTSRLRLLNLPAGTYNVVVDTKTTTSGSIPVDVYITTPGPESDRCGNPHLHHGRHHYP